MHDSAQCTCCRMERDHQQHRANELCPSAATRWYLSPVSSAISWFQSPLLSEDTYCVWGNVGWWQRQAGSWVSHWQYQTQSGSDNSASPLTTRLKDTSQCLHFSLNNARKCQLSLDTARKRRQLSHTIIVPATWCCISLGYSIGRMISLINKVNVNRSVSSLYRH